MSTITYLWPDPDHGGEGQEGADTYLDANAQTTNFSTETKIKVGFTGLGGRYLGLIRFALPDGPPFIGTDYLWSATLRLHVVLNQHFPLDVWHLERVWNATEACYCYRATSGSNQNWVDGGTNCNPPTNEGGTPTVTGPIGWGIWHGDIDTPVGEISIPLTVEPGSTVWDLVQGGLLLAFRPYAGFEPTEPLQIESWESAGYTQAPELDIEHDSSPPPWYVPSGIGYRAGSGRKFRFQPCGGSYPCCGYYYCYGSYYCCHCNYFSYGGLAPCCQYAALSGFTGDYEFLNKTWRLAQCTLPEPDGVYCNEFHCPPCTWRATYCTPTGDEEIRCINLRIWNDGTVESPAYKARLTVEGSTFEKDLGATKPYVLDSVGAMTRTIGNEGASSVEAELEDGECQHIGGQCRHCRCTSIPFRFLVRIRGITIIYEPSDSYCTVVCDTLNADTVPDPIQPPPLSDFCWYDHAYAEECRIFLDPGLPWGRPWVDVKIYDKLIEVRAGFQSHRWTGEGNWVGFWTVFKKTYAEVPNCSAFNDEDIPYFGTENTAPSLPWCEGVNATCKLTAF